MIAEQLRKMANIQYEDFLAAADAEDDDFWDGKFSTMRYCITRLLAGFDDDLLERISEKGERNG